MDYPCRKRLARSGEVCPQKYYQAIWYIGQWVSCPEVDNALKVRAIEEVSQVDVVSG
jgi:hypothetical protein